MGTTPPPIKRKEKYKPNKVNRSNELQNLRARAMNAERMVKKLSDERIIIKGWSVFKNFVILFMTIYIIYSIIF